VRLTAVFACGPALAGGLALILLSAPPAAADFFGFPGQWQQRNWNAERPPAAKPQHKSHRTARPSKHETAHKEPRPQGPFQIVVSIAKQQVAVYGQDGLVMQAPISTGMPGHPTPLGVFTVLSKAKWHQSNIYSGAPMPYMQRVTWSGIAMHAGPRPGYPASHGCIRLPEDFAVRLFHTTKVGARVIITREPAAPAGIVHPKLFVPKPPEAKVAAVTPASATAKDTISFAANTAVIVKPTDAATKTDATGAIATIPIPPRPANRLASEPPHPDKPISVFVSRKQNKVFVRQGTTPLFNMPATISEPDSPIGTHVFTAMGLKDDGKAMRWMVVSVPSTYRHYVSHSRKRHRGDKAVEAEPAAPASAASEALDRITLPPEAIERISAMLLPGSSLIVSDNALSDETDADTDFIVETR
jgi:L,D-transpeptidase catalytic domain